MDKDKLYCIIMTDPDAKDRIKHEYREWVHWVMINVSITENKNKTEFNGKYLFDTLTNKDDNTVIEFKPSGPPSNTGLHRYVFLVYQQNDKIDINKCGQDKITLKNKGNRAKWKAMTFAKNNKLDTLIAGSYYQTQKKK